MNLFSVEPNDSLVAEPKTKCELKNQTLQSNTKSTQPGKPCVTKPKPVVDAKCKPSPRKHSEPIQNNHQIPKNRPPLSCALPERNAAGKPSPDINPAEQGKRSASGENFSLHSIKIHCSVL